MSPQDGGNNEHLLYYLADPEFPKKIVSADAGDKDLAGLSANEIWVFLKKFAFMRVEQPDLIRGFTGAAIFMAGKWVPVLLAACANAQMPAPVGGAAHGIQYTWLSGRGELGQLNMLGVPDGYLFWGALAIQPIKFGATDEFFAEWENVTTKNARNLYEIGVTVGLEAGSAYSTAWYSSNITGHALNRVSRGEG